MDCNLLGSSVHGILQARIREWVAISFSKCWGCKPGSSVKHSSSLILIFYWGLVDLQCCVSFRYMNSDSVTYINVYMCVHTHTHAYTSFLGGTSGKELACQCRRHKTHQFVPWFGKIPWRRAWQPTPVFVPRVFHGQRSLWGTVAKNQTWLKWLSIHVSSVYILILY